MEMYKPTIENLLPVTSEYQQYLGHSLKELQGVFKNSTIQKLKKYEIYTKQKYHLPVLDALFLLNQQSKSLRVLAKAIHINGQTLARVFKYLRMPYLLHKESITRYFQKLTSTQKDKRRKNAFKASKARSLKQLRDTMRKIQQSLTPEQCRRYGRMGGLATQASLTTEQKREQIERMNFALTIERRRELDKKLAIYHASMPADKKSE